MPAFMLRELNEESWGAVGRAVARGREGGGRHSARGSVIVTVAILAQGTLWLLHSCKHFSMPALMLRELNEESWGAVGRAGARGRERAGGIARGVRS